MDKKIERLINLKEAYWKFRIYLQELIRLESKISNLKDILEIVYKEEDKTHEKLKNIRKICAHNWVYGGHGHNDDWYKCTICGETEDR